MSKEMIMALDQMFMAQGGKLLFPSAAGPVWGLAENDQLSTYFSPRLVRRHGGTQVLGVIGIWVEAFEVWWRQEFRSDQGKLKDPELLFSLYITNLPPLMNPPAFQDHRSGLIEGWVAKISTETRNRLISWEDLVAEVLRPDRTPVRVFDYICVAEKLMAFLIWLREHNGVALSGVRFPEVADGARDSERLKTWAGVSGS